MISGRRMQHGFESFYLFIKTRLLRTCPNACMKTFSERTKKNCLSPCPVIRICAVFPLSTGGEASVRWAFIEEAKVQPDYPQYECPAIILHGVNDEVVPPMSSKFLMEGRWVGSNVME